MARFLRAQRNKHLFVTWDTPRRGPCSCVVCLKPPATIDLSCSRDYIDAWDSSTAVQIGWTVPQVSLNTAFDSTAIQKRAPQGGQACKGCTTRLRAQSTTRHVPQIG